MFRRVGDTFTPDNFRSNEEKSSISKISFCNGESFVFGCLNQNFINKFYSESN